MLGSINDMYIYRGICRNLIIFSKTQTIQKLLSFVKFYYTHSSLMTSAYYSFSISLSL